MFRVVIGSLLLLVGANFVYQAKISAQDQFGQPLPSNDQLKQEIVQIDAQIKQLQQKRDNIKQNLGYFTNETSGSQQGEGLTYRQNADREKYYQAQLSDIETQIASLQSKKEQLSLLVQ